MHNGDDHVVVLRASQTALSGAGRLLVVLSVPWAIILLFGTDAVLNAVGMPNPERSPALRILWISVAVTPALVAFFVRPIGALPGFRWLLAWPQPRATVNQRGLELALPNAGVRTFEWSEVAELVAHARWSGSGELRDREGSKLATIPYSLMHPQPEWRTFRTLAEAVTEVNPERYVLTDYNWFGIAYGFALHERAGADRHITVAAGARRSRVKAVIWIVTGGLALVAAAVWLSSAP